MHSVSHVHPIEGQIQRFLAEKAAGIGNVQSAWTTDFYENALVPNFLPWALAHDLTDAEQMTPQHWHAYTAELRSRRLADATVQTYLRGVKIFLRSLNISSDRLKKDFLMPKQARRMLDYLTREEIDRLEEVATNERDKLIVRVLANTGIRLGELTGLKLKDLKEIRSPFQFYRIRVFGKGSKEREVPIDRAAYKRLEAFAMSGGERTYIFPALQHDRKAGTLVMMDGERLSNNAVDKMFRELKKAAMIAKPCTPHKLRHAFATHALQSGMSIEKLQQILGHRDLTMIVNVYSHLTPDDASREYDRVFGVKPPAGGMESKRRRRIAVA